MHFILTARWLSSGFAVPARYHGEKP